MTESQPPSLTSALSSSSEKQTLKPPPAGYMTSQVHAVYYMYCTNMKQILVVFSGTFSMSSKCTLHVHVHYIRSKYNACTPLPLPLPSSPSLTHTHSPYRAEGCLHRLAELNPYVTVTTSSVPLHSHSDLSFLSNYQVHSSSMC